MLLKGILIGIELGEFDRMCVMRLLFPCWQKVVLVKIRVTRFDLLCFCSVLCLLCLCVRLFICALWSPAGKGVTSWLSFVVSTVSLSLSHWYPGSGVVLDCIDSWSLHPYLLWLPTDDTFSNQSSDSIYLLVDNFFKNISDFATAGDWDCVLVVESLPVLHYSVDFIFLYIVIIDSVVEL